MSEKMSAREVIIEALAPDVSKHTPEQRRMIKDLLAKWDAKHADAILAALKANGYAVVDLPKPKYREPHGYGYSNENPRLSHWSVFACTEDGCVYDQNDGFSPEDAWTIGSWWLAASRCITEREVAAERDSEER